MDSFLHNSTTFYHKTIDLLGNYTYFNDLYLSIFNFSGTVSKGKKCLNLVFNDDVALVEDCMQKLLSREFTTCKIKVRKKISKTNFIWTEWEYSTILNNKNEIIGFNCVGFKKISSHEETLFIHELTDGINGVITELLIDENLNITWKFLSEGVENLYEITLKQAQENPNIIYDLINKEDFENSKTVFINAIKNTTPYFIQHRITTPSGKRKWIEISSIPKKQKNNSTIWHGFHQDITDKKTLEIANKSNELLLKKLSKDINGGLAQLKMYENKEFECTYMSEGMERFSEFSFEEVQDNPKIIFNIIHPDDRVKVIKTIFNAFKALTPYSNQYRIVTKSGNVKWLNVNASPKQQLDGSVVFNAFYEDITVQKLQEVENIKNQNLISNLTNNLKCVVYQFKMTSEKEFFFQFIGENLNSIFEVDFADVEKDPFLLHNMILEEDVQMVSNRSDTAFKNLNQFSTQYRIKTPSGKRKWIEASSNPQKQDDGSVVFYGFFNDITAIKTLEFENLKAQQQLENLTDNIKGVLTQFKIDENLNISWQYMSKGAEDIYEMGFDYIKKNEQKFEALIEPSDLKKTKLDFKTAIKNSASFTSQYRITTPSGILKWVEINSYPKKTNNNTLVWYGYHLDVTDKKNLEITQKKSELKIIENERFLKNITNNLQGMLTMSKIDSFEAYHLEYVSKGIEALYEISFKEFKKDNKKLLNQVVAKDLINTKKQMDFAIKNITPMFLQYRIVTPSGKTKWIEVSSYPQKQVDGNVIWYGFHSDITQTKKLEIENLINEEKLKFIVDNTSSSIIMFENNKVSYISNNYQKIFGFAVVEETQRLNTCIWDIIADEDENKLKIKNQLKLAIKKQQKQNTIQYKYLHKNGNLIWRKDEINFFYNENGLVSKAVVLVSDITEKKKLENLVLNQNLQLALQIEENEKISENFLAFQNDKWLEISQNLHDNISQLLFAANLHLNNFNSKDASLIKANGLIKMALDEIKFVTQSTKNLLIQNKGLENALTELVENNNYLKNISITKKINPDFCKRFSNSEQIILFTIIQEAMQNAIKHSEGTAIKIVLDIKNGHYFASIKDNGIGLKQNFINGMGVYNIEKNVSLLNGTLKYLNKNGLELSIEFL